MEEHTIGVPGKAKRKVRGRVVLLVVVGVFALGMGGMLLAAEPGLREARELVIADVDFASLRDGSYQGAYQGVKDSLRDTTVQVTVASGRVTGIQVTGGAMANEPSLRLLGGLLDRVVQAQSLQVDVVSGATVSSQVLLKAVENALSQAAK